MAVEPHDGSSLPDVLVESNPPSDDPVNQGDDHLRLLKIVTSNFYTQYLADATAIDGRVAVLEAFAALGDAATLGGQNALFYQNSDNQAFGTLPAARLSGTYGINISGNAATATLAADATHAANADEAVHAVDSDKLGGLTLAELQEPLGQDIDQSAVGSTTIANSTWQTILTKTFPAALTTGRIQFSEVTFTTTADEGGSFSHTVLGAMRFKCNPSNKLIVPEMPADAVADCGAAGVTVGNANFYTQLHTGAGPFVKNWAFSITNLVPSGTTSIEMQIQRTSSTYPTLGGGVSNKVWKGRVA